MSLCRARRSSGLPSDVYRYMTQISMRKIRNSVIQRSFQRLPFCDVVVS